MVAPAEERAVLVAPPVVPADAAGASEVADADAEDTSDEAAAEAEPEVMLPVALRPAKRGQVDMHEVGTVTDEGSREGAELDPWLCPSTVSILGIRPTPHFHYHSPIPYVCASFSSRLGPLFWLPRWGVPRWGVLTQIEVLACSSSVAHGSFAWRPALS